MSVKRLKITTINKEATRKRLVCSQVVLLSSFSDSIVFAVHTQYKNSVFKQYCFQIVPLWRTFSKRSVFGDRFQRCSVDGSRIRNKTITFSFENGVVWTGSKLHNTHLLSSATRQLSRRLAKMFDS